MEWSLSSREARPGPVGAAYTRSGIVVATDGSLKKSGAIGAAYVAKHNRLPSRSLAVFGQPSSIRPALEDCPGEEDLNVITNSISSMRLLKNIQSQDFPLHHHHASLLKIINKTGSLFRCLGALRHFLSLSFSQRNSSLSSLVLPLSLALSRFFVF